MDKYTTRVVHGLALATLISAPLSAQAAGSAVIQTGKESTTLRWLDSKTVRIDMADGESYLLVREGKAYAVNNEPRAGVPRVMEISAMAGEMGMQDENGLSSISQKPKSFKKLGKSETIAGIKGEIYEVTDEKTGEIQQMVLTNNRQAQEMTEAMLAIKDSTTNKNSLEAFKAGLPKGLYGILRVENEMLVKSLSPNAPPAEAFELPEAPMDMKQMLEQMLQR